VSIRLLLADDQILVRTGLRVILETEPDLEVVGEAGDGAEAVRLARALAPDVVLMDIRMPVLDGIQATAQLLDGPDPTPTSVLVLTTFDADEYVFAALCAGASGFLLKHASPEDLVAAVRTVAAGDALLAPAVTRRLIAEFARVSPETTASPALEELTPRERDVLRLIARGRSNGEIADTLAVGHSTVKSHVEHLLLKLGVRDRVHAVIHAYESGFVRPGGTSAVEPGGRDTG